MANVMFTLQSATVSTLNIVNSTATMLNAGTGALADLAQGAAVHASAYRADAEAKVKETEQHRRIVGAMEAHANISERLLSIQARLDANPALAAMYAKVTAEAKAIAA